jgi:NAD(P)-dependent dehydrogenase (short-subunit alcohol dehydrogenase family)
MAFGGSPIYAASKATVDSLARSYAAQFAESHDEHIMSLSVVTINPGLYETEIADRFTGNNEDVKEIVAKMLNPSQRVGKAEGKTILNSMQASVQARGLSSFQPLSRNTLSYPV